ncbi:hypothetical protein ACSBR2_026739 [Camellia fascicularis]
MVNPQILSIWFLQSTLVPQASLHKLHQQCITMRLMSLASKDRDRKRGKERRIGRSGEKRNKEGRAISQVAMETTDGWWWQLVGRDGGLRRDWVAGAVCRAVASHRVEEVREILFRLYLDFGNNAFLPS